MNTDDDENKTSMGPSNDSAHSKLTKENESDQWSPQQLLNLEDLKFAQSVHFMGNKKCQLLEGSFLNKKNGYEEVHVPALKPKLLEKDSLMPIKDLPRYVQPAFKDYFRLNLIQSAVHKAALETGENLLICAPKGAGKKSQLFFVWCVKLAKM